MGRPKYRDMGIRPKGSPEIGFDPDILVQLCGADEADEGHNEERRKRTTAVFNFIVKIALKILPPKQRKIFYSVWVRSGGNLSKGVMEFSRKTRQSHYTNYNNIYKAVHSLKNYLAKSGYEKMIIDYLQNGQHAEEFE